MRTFVLGIGAQKAGTSWVYKQLSKSDNFKRPITKEMHILDALHVSESKRFRERIERRFAKAVVKGRDHYMPLSVTKQMGMLLDPGAYFEYYDELLSEDNALSCDVTPAYSGLSAAVLDQVRAGFDAKGINLRVVFLMREPVSRVESAVRMVLRKRSGGRNLRPEEIMEGLKKHAGSNQERIRSNYRSTVRNARQAFSSDQLYFGFYETLFQSTEIAKLAKFCGADSSRFDSEEMVNHGKMKYVYPETFLADLRSLYHDQYDLASEDFGFDVSIWDAEIRKLTQGGSSR